MAPCQLSPSNFFAGVNTSIDVLCMQSLQSFFKKNFQEFADFTHLEVAFVHTGLKPLMFRAGSLACENSLVASAGWTPQVGPLSSTTLCFLSELKFVVCDTTMSGYMTGWQRSKHIHERQRRHHCRGNCSLDVEHVRDRFLVAADYDRFTSEHAGTRSGCVQVLAIPATATV